MTAPQDDLPPLPEKHETGETQGWSEYDMRAYALAARTPLLARLAEQAKEIERLRESYLDQAKRAVSAERDRDELRQRLEALIGAADRLHADTMYKWAPEAKDYYMKVRAEIERPAQVDVTAVVAAAQTWLEEPK